MSVHPITIIAVFGLVHACAQTARDVPAPMTPSPTPVVTATESSPSSPDESNAPVVNDPHDAPIMNRRDRAIRAIQTFLHIEGTDVGLDAIDAGLRPLGQVSRNPLVADEEVQTYSTPWGNFDVTDEGGVCSWSAPDMRTPPVAPISPDEARERARAFLSRHVPWWNGMATRFEDQTCGGCEGTLQLAWIRIPADGEVAVYPVDASASVSLSTGRVRSMAFSTRLHARTAPLALDEPTVRARILRQYPRAAIDAVELWVDIMAGQFRTIWAARITARGGERGQMRVRLAFDVDTGELIERLGDETRPEITPPPP